MTITRDTEMIDSEGREWIVTGGGVVLCDRMRVPMIEIYALPLHSDVRAFLASRGVPMTPRTPVLQVGLRLSPEAVARLSDLRHAWGVSPSEVVERLLRRSRVPKRDPKAAA